MPLDGTILGKGVYTPREAARLIGATSTDVLRWTRGSGSTEPVWRAHYQFLDDASELSFLDLVELRVVNALRRKSISLQAIRYAVQFIQEKFGISRPLSSECFRLDGSEILMTGLEGEDAYISLAKKRAGQKVFKSIIEQSISGIEYDGMQPKRWRPQLAKHVVIDPDRSFGAPLLDENGISTKVIYVEWSFSKSFKYVSRLYEIDEKLVRDAVSYEVKLDELQKIAIG